MIINKIGFEHLLYGVNCQDFISDEKFKCVVDGCSEGKHSEVGAKLFINLFNQGYSIENVFLKLTEIFKTKEDIKDYLLFTILYISETETEFVVHECGDGFIIKEKINGDIEFEEINYQNMPPYFAYNYIDTCNLKKYKEGVSFNTYFFSKEEYSNIGIATDGLAYILNSQYKNQFIDLLKKRKSTGIKRLINQNHNYQFFIHSLSDEVINQIIPFDYKSMENNFKDDISIVF